MRSKLFCSTFAALFLIFFMAYVSPALAAWPEKPLQIIVPYPAGGQADAIVRIMQSSLSKTLGVPVAVINTPGVSATRGLVQVVETKPDGYTVGLFQEAVIGTYLTGITKYNFSNLDAVCNLVYSPIMIVGNANAPWKDLSGMVNAAKSKPGEMKYGVLLGSATHFAILDLCNKAGISMRMVPYDGHAERQNALLGGYVDGTDTGPVAAVSYLKAKKFVAIAMLTDERLPGFEDIPTAKEQGVDVSFAFHYGLYAPKGTNPEITAKLSEACRIALQDVETAKRLDTSGNPVRYMDAKTLDEHNGFEMTRIDAVAEKSGMKKLQQ
ncbi:MAG: tripartite tricarboxylate transporter substrate binding protein [Desulfovibrio sp.]|jgi:tripartite-type tricarboxylate transporter receptor subunit TctC|nr:tripartite tricarboxylate transporter substrate binding protein [Desulfovibrio sp.]